VKIILLKYRYTTPISTFLLLHSSRDLAPLMLRVDQVNSGLLTQDAASK